MQDMHDAWCTMEWWWILEGQPLDSIEWRWFSIVANLLSNNPLIPMHWYQTLAQVQSGCKATYFSLSLSLIDKLWYLTEKRSAKGPVPNLLIFLFQFALFFIKDYHLQFSMPIITQGHEKIQQFCQDVFICKITHNHSRLWRWRNVNLFKMCLFAKLLIFTHNHSRRWKYRIILSRFVYLQKHS